MKVARSFVWVDPSDCIPPHGLDLASPRDANKVEALRKAFEEKGFDKKYPALVGYALDGKVQLLSGTHRHLAAAQAGIQLPVTLWLRSDVEETWGTDLWSQTIEDVSVSELETWPVVDGVRRSPYEAVTLEALSDGDL